MLYENIYMSYILNNSYMHVYVYVYVSDMA